VAQTPDLSTAETLAKNPPVVNRAGSGQGRGRRVTGPFFHVSAASVSLLKGGDWHLLMRTAEGPAQFIVPAHIARGFLRLTNPPCEVAPRKLTVMTL